MILNNLYYNFSETCQKGLGMNAVRNLYGSVAVFEQRKFWKEQFFSDNTKKIHYIEQLKAREVDAYASVNKFSTAKRSEATIQTLEYLYCDLDCHKGIFNEWLTLDVLRSDFFNVTVPYPSKIINSGRGLHLFWELKNEGAESLAKWKVVQQIILNNLASISEQTNCTVDFRCIDPSRVLRLVDTHNTISKTKCRQIEETKLVYTLDDILECFYDVNISDLKPFRFNPSKDKDTSKKTLTDAKNMVNERGEWKDLKVRSANGVIKLFNAHSLLTNRARDFRKLLELRNGDMEGMRDEFLTMYAWTVISKKDDLEKLERELHGINSLFKAPLKDKEVSYKAKYIFERFNKEVIKGADTSQFTEFDRYWYKNTTIIKRLEITPKEQKEMLTIISKEEKNERDKARKKKNRRNENGLTSREQEKADRYNTIQELKRLGYTQKAVSDTLNISLPTVKRYWK